MDHCIVYTSSSVGLFQEDDLLAILHQSRKNNSESGITGVLLYVNGSIIQVLEGRKEAIESLYQRIVQDGRHTGVTRIINCAIKQRLFANWTMGYQTITTRQLDNIETVLDLDNYEELALESDGNIILKMINLFYHGNQYN